jgi:hypothetical protein
LYVSRGASNDTTNGLVGAITDAAAADIQLNGALLGGLDLLRLKLCADISTADAVRVNPGSADADLINDGPALRRASAIHKQSSIRISSITTGAKPSLCFNQHSEFVRRCAILLATCCSIGNLSNESSNGAVNFTMGGAVFCTTGN